MAEIQKRFQQAIDECRKKRLTALDLSSKPRTPDRYQLREIPPEVFEFTWLKKLNVSLNQLTVLPESIGSLSSLTRLDLRGNRLTGLPESIGSLDRLTNLNVSKNRLTSLPESIGSLSSLTRLDLRGNRLTGLPESFGSLDRLTNLNLSQNLLTSLPESFGSLDRLTRLDLSQNQLTILPEPFGDLYSLTKLDLSQNQLTVLPESFGALSSLTELNVSLTQLTVLPESFGSLSSLTDLYLSYSQLIALPESFGSLSSLTKLDLSQNQLTALPESFGSLSSLTGLYLSQNQLSILPESFGSLSSLASLNLNENKLISLPESFGSLSRLTKFDLSYNQLTVLSEFFGSLSSLTWLDLSHNQLTVLPKAISSLSSLTHLNFSHNQLTVLPQSIGSLSNLTWLDLSGNQLTVLPESLGFISSLISLYLWDNPLEEPPLEVANRSIEAIREYFRQKREAGEDTLYEAKLLIVGEGEAGKTTLARRIDDPNCPLPTLDESTEGIDVKEWHFTADNTKDFRVNIWDFGGQEILHATHQFFLTKRSLYLLVIDSRKESPNLSYWLHIVELLSDNSPLLLIKNEKNNYTVNISESQIKGRFENIRDSIPCNFADNRGLDNIVTAIKYQIQQLPHVGSTLPKTWIRVREEIEKNERDYISLEEYLRICDTNGFKQEKDALQLSQYLHDIGVILHFQEEQLSLLYKTVILKPEWATQAVYKVIRSETVKQNRGKFTTQDLGDIWQAREYARMRGELLELMIKFKLCYRFPNEPNTYIAPQLLDTDPSEYEWNDRDNLILRYCYDFMPKGILSRFVVELHHLIDEPKVWRSGVILKKEKTFAEVIETYDQKEIKIRLYGVNKRDLLTTITDKFDEIHRTYNRLIVDKRIPCHCSKCLNQQTPHFYRLEVLKRYRGDHRETIECQESYERVNVRGLIDDFESGVGGRNLVPSIDRVQLRRTLTDLIPANFNTLKFVIKPPAGIVAPKDASQAERVDDLLEWAESPTGCGLERIQEVLEEILNDR